MKSIQFISEINQSDLFNQCILLFTVDISTHICRSQFSQSYCWCEIPLMRFCIIFTSAKECDGWRLPV